MPERHRRRPPRAPRTLTDRARPHGIGRGRAAVLAFAAAIHVGASAGPPAHRAEPARPFTTANERCILPAASYHGVNPHVLRAILKVESGLRPDALARNANGSIDKGIGQINSQHFPALQKQGVYPEFLADACIGTYVAGWHLARVVAKHGNTWEGIATYHSGSPYCNRRYQVLVHNEMVSAGVVAGQLQAVPPFRQCVPVKKAKGPAAAASRP